LVNSSFLIALMIKIIASSLMLKLNFLLELVQIKKRPFTSI